MDRLKKENSGCCSPSFNLFDPTERYAFFQKKIEEVPRAESIVRQELYAELYEIPGGIFEMGTRCSMFTADLDGPPRKVKVSDFLMAPFAVTNLQFARFIEASGYKTVAEYDGWSYVFHLLLSKLSQFPVYPPGLPWWRQVHGACWHSPEGPGSSLLNRFNHPVVHVSWFDAMAYCRWSGLSLPTEAQWERAARGGLAKKKYPWGNVFKPNGEYAMNTFQGEFPNWNSLEDNYLATAPVNSFKPNGFGMFNMTGNVWEWVSDRFGPLPQKCLPPIKDPKGAIQGVARVQRGGSYLCHESYCERYYVHSRTRNDPDSSAGNTGFRVAF